ncbi:MAG TPA: GAF domain-containing protein [Blastocatellia bacterium]
MFNYLAFICGGISEPGRSPEADGLEMAAECLGRIEETGNPEHFPPRLLILLTSPAYGDAEIIREAIQAIRRSFAEYKSKVFAKVEDESVEVPLIGSSVEGVFFDRQVQARGALLVCLASRLIDAEVHVSRNLRDDHEGAVADLIERLGLSLLDTEINARTPLIARLLLSFLPNIGRHDENDFYIAPDLHRLILQKARTRIPLVGGVSSRPGFQFAGSEVYHDEIVAASIFTGSPFSSSFCRGLTGSGALLRVEGLGADGRTVRKFDREGSPADALDLRDRADFALVEELSPDHDPFVIIARIADDRKSVIMTRKVAENTIFRRLAVADLSRVRMESRRRLELSLGWWALEKPVGCLAIHCASQLRSGLDVRAMAGDAEDVINRGEVEPATGGRDVYFGGFFDGEIGADDSGRYLFGNCGVATLCFGDEMRDRTPTHTGFKAISEPARSLTGFVSLTEALKGSLKIIFETGFPGAMLSLLMKDKECDWLVAMSAVGSRFEKIVDMTKRPLNRPAGAEDILSVVARNGKPEFIADSRANAHCDREAVRKSGIVSQYIIPLFDSEKNLIATLQIDLGDLSRRRRGLYKTEERIMLSLGAVVRTMILRVLNSQEAGLSRELDQVLMQSLQAAELDEALRIYIERAAKLFKVDAGHVRLLKADENALEMATGTGDYYEAFKYSRRKTAVDGDSPTALAFREKQAVVVNESSDDPWRKSLLISCRETHSAHSTLLTARSYANTPISDGHGNLTGTISLISHQPWFFARPRVRALEALGRRVSYLLEHFKAQIERRFLLDISSNFVRNADFSQPVLTINETVKRFRKAANAHVASLFIWDEEAERFVLRAQDGWSDEKWVDAARYKRGEHWTGGLASSPEPQYVADMFMYKNMNGLSSNVEYQTHAFGEPLSENFTVEAIGLPLRLKRDRTIGLLTLFRRVDKRQPGKSSGFTTTDPHILQEAADTISAMLSALLYNLRMKWLKGEMKRHEDVRDALEKGDSGVPIEQRLCRQMVVTFNFLSATLYLATDDGLRWAAGANPKVAAPEPSEPDEMVLRAASEKKLRGKKKDKLSDEERRDPVIAKTEGLLERISLPLRNEGRLVGVLDLRLRTVRKKSHLVAMHDPERLEELARKIALVYQQQKELERKAEAEAQAEKGKLAVQAMGAMVFQTAHRLINLTQNIRSLSLLIDAAETEAEQRARLSELSQQINSATARIKRPMEIARRMKEITPKPYNLHDLITEVLLESDIRQHLISPEISIRIPERLVALVDHDLIREAFRNIIHNAMKAMPQGGALTITASPNDDRRTAQMIFTDTGVGMNEEQIQAALSGFLASPGGAGLGVMLSQLLIRAQGGDLRIRSSPGIGTDVIVTLPARNEEASCRDARP